ncbi:DUF4145 domain-containing protein [Paenibacillus sp. FSL H7-0941]|uniref:DUF4145 domain-containing protein n=1 Tax=unclassified Paenibacillus TaxID=185978 RepID=UPI0030F595C2
MQRHSGSWEDTIKIGGIIYTCGYCGSKTSPSFGYKSLGYDGYDHFTSGYICICPGCNNPTFLVSEKSQVPGPLIGRKIKNLPEEIESLYDEIRKCISVSAYTSAVLSSRKLLMNIAVHQGAPENKRFVEYVDYLETNHYIPPQGRSWVDKIRRKGNEATHEIAVMDKSDGEELFSFLEVLLIFVFEFMAIS